MDASLPGEYWRWHSIQQRGFPHLGRAMSHQGWWPSQACANVRGQEGTRIWSLHRWRLFFLRSWRTPKKGVPQCPDDIVEVLQIVRGDADHQTDIRLAG